MDVALLAKVDKRPIIIYKNGKVYNIIGKGLPGEPISLSHSAEGIGHWAPIDKSIQVTVSGENNCLYDAVAAQMSTAEREKLGVQNGQDFRQHVVKEIQNNATITQQFMAQAAELSYLKPAAMLEGGWRWRVDMDTPNGVGAIVKVDDEGGADTQYYEYVRNKKDAVGNPILDAAGNPEKETVVTTIPGVSLNMIPVVETDYSTACLTHIPQANPEETYNGVMLFPKGPGCNEDGTNRRLETGTYNLCISPLNSSLTYPGALRFYRGKPLTGGNPLLWKQARVIHTGNHFDNTRGCGLPGRSFLRNYTFTVKKEVKGKDGKVTKQEFKYTDTFVTESDVAREKLEETVQAFGVDKKDNCSLQAVMCKSFDEVKEESKEAKKEK